MKKLLLTTVTLCVLFCSFGINGILLTQGMFLEASIPFTLHEPIVIDSNDDFTSEGFSGKGTADEPYTISFLEFTDDIDGACINISDTTAYFEISNCSFNTTDFACAINLQNVMNGHIQYCTTGSNIWSIKIHASYNIELEYLTSNACIMMEYSGLCNISHCSIYGAPGDGVLLENCINVTIKECDISACAASGICLYNTLNSLIVGNSLQSYDNGIFIYGDSFNNRIFNNILFPMELYVTLAYDLGSANCWDDGVSTGNWWDDYSGSGEYSIGGSAGSVDHYPMGHSSVVLVSHDDAKFKIGSTASITWTAFSEVPSYYMIFINDMMQETKSWDGFDISTNVDTDIIGVFNYTLFVMGTSGSNKVDTVIVTIYNEAPTIDSPEDVTYQQGQTGNSITWHSHDTDPDYYQIFQNGTLNSTEAWDGSAVTYSVDGLSVGVYYFKLRVNDTSGNFAEDTVLVNVTVGESTTNTTTSGSNVDIRIVVIIGIGVAVVIVIILVVKLRK